ncbi:hypothetical protein [uncultured Sphingobacterium sp.]|uniref:hypothetical protein n=1 Tax=uncultured Sphingobacterium sp. TaxID=182688 RepID=UPI0025E0D405|nr:hypothetical protein [uncultured Sphingobacterium sp.]
MSKGRTHPGVWYKTMVKMQVRSADTGAQYPYDGILRMEDLWHGGIFIGTYAIGPSIIHCKHNIQLINDRKNSARPKTLNKGRNVLSHSFQYFTDRGLIRSQRI